MPDAHLGSIVVDLINWIQPYFVAAAYVIIPVAVMLERSVFVGLVVPGDLILALGGVYAGQGELSLGLVIGLGIFAAIIGESAGYWIGRRHGMGLVRRLPVLNRFDDRLERSEDFFRRNGGKTVVIGRYATAIGAFVPFTAGVAKMPYHRFLLYDVPSIIVWATAITVFGFYFGENLEFVDTVLSRFGLSVLGLVLVVFLGRFLLKRRRERRERATQHQQDRD
jgi:membrane protein DedA with SNARE-associated domain